MGSNCSPLLTIPFGSRKQSTFKFNCKQFFCRDVMSKHNVAPWIYCYTGYTLYCRWHTLSGFQTSSRPMNGEGICDFLGEAWSQIPGFIPKILSIRWEKKSFPTAPVTFAMKFRDLRDKVPSGIQQERAPKLYWQIMRGFVLWQENIRFKFNKLFVILFSESGSLRLAKHPGPGDLQHSWDLT